MLSYFTVTPLVLNVFFFQLCSKHFGWCYKKYKDEVDLISSSHEAYQWAGKRAPALSSKLLPFLQWKTQHPNSKKELRNSSLSVGASLSSSRFGRRRVEASVPVWSWPLGFGPSPSFPWASQPRLLLFLSMDFCLSLVKGLRLKATKNTTWGILSFTKYCLFSSKE